MSAVWHYSVSGSRNGPVTAGDLKRLADGGQLSPSDLVWKEGLPNWVPASSVKGLFANASAPPPLPASSATSAAADDLKPKVEAAARATADAAKAAVKSLADDVKPKVEVAARATADAARAAVKSLAASKPIVGFHIQRAGAGVASILGSLATFLPWFTAPVVGTVYGTAGDGWITLPLFIPAIFFACRGDRLRPIDGWQRFAVAVPAAIAGLIGVRKIIWLNMRLSQMRSELSDNPLAAAMASVAAATVQTRFGLYLIVLAGAGVAAAVFLLRSKDDGVSLS
jgi:hypothetical protein